MRRSGGDALVHQFACLTEFFNSFDIHQRTTRVSIITPMSIMTFISLPSNFMRKTTVKFSATIRVLSLQGPYSH